MLWSDELLRAVVAKFWAFYESMLLFFSICFFFNDTATTEIYTLSLHDALPILAHMLEKLFLG